MSSKKLMSHYILYALKNEINSEKVISLIRWITDDRGTGEIWKQEKHNISRDGMFKLIDVSYMNRPLAKWLNGVPILADMETKNIYKGTDCLKEVKMIIQNNEDTLQYSDNQTENLPKKEEKEFVLPRDPRDPPVSAPMPVPVPTQVTAPVPAPMPAPVPIPVPTSMPVPVPASAPRPVSTPVSTPVPTSVPTPVPTSVPTPVPTPVGKVAPVTRTIRVPSHTTTNMDAPPTMNIEMTSSLLPKPEVDG